MERDAWLGLADRGLLEKGEERLIAAVDSGLIPLTLAATIARSDDAGIQQALAEAYADGKIKGGDVELVRRRLERRQRRGGFGAWSLHSLGSRKQTRRPDDMSLGKRPSRRIRAMRASRKPIHVHATTMHCKVNSPSIP